MVLNIRFLNSIEKNSFASNGGLTKQAESSAKITEANEKGKELAQEVQSNMGFIKNINENLASITSETIQVN